MGCESQAYLNIENWVINDECDTTNLFKWCDNLSLIKCSKETYERILGNDWVYENGFAIREGKV